MVANATVKRGDVVPVIKGSINDTGEELAELPVSWLLSAVEEQFEFHASICAEAISPTYAGHSGWMRCLLHTAVFV